MTAPPKPREKDHRRNGQARLTLADLDRSRLGQITAPVFDTGGRKMAISLQTVGLGVFAIGGPAYLAGVLIGRRGIEQALHL